jgi:cell wall-associated NlpC family hydrolase
MFILLFSAAAMAGCATAPPTRSGAPEPLDGSAQSPPQGAAVEIAFIALSLVGTPYSEGGFAPETGFDCSGLVAYVFARGAQLRLPRNTFDLARTGEPVESGRLRPGDLVFYNTQRRAYSHVGIYLGEARFVHAPSTGGTVRVEDMRLAYWTQRFDGARRLSF